MKPVIVGMVGRKRTGKDTFYELVRAKLPNAERIAFADEVKRELSVATGISIEQMEREKDRFRPGQQWWGTEFRRFDDENYWIKKAAKKMYAQPECPCFVFTDVRMANEAAWIRKKGGILVKLTRIDGKRIDHHVSEIGVDRIQGDFEIVNPMTTIPEFRKAASVALTYIINSVRERA